MLRRMEEPSAAKIASALRKLLPDEFLAEFDDDMSSYGDLDGDVTVCGVLLAFSGSFRLLIRRRDSIRDVLEFVDDLLVRHRPEGGVAPRDGSVYNSLLACFPENVLPVPSGGVPNRRPVPRTRGARACFAVRCLVAGAERGHKPCVNGGRIPTVSALPTGLTMD